MEKKIEINTLRVYIGGNIRVIYIGMMEKDMETTSSGSGFECFWCLKPTRTRFCYKKLTRSISQTLTMPLCQLMHS